MKIGLEPVHPNGPRKQMNATKASVTGTNNIQLLVGANRDVMQAMGFLTAAFFLDGKRRIYSAKMCVRGWRSWLDL